MIVKRYIINFENSNRYTYLIIRFIKNNDLKKNAWNLENYLMTEIFLKFHFQNQN